MEMGPIGALCWWIQNIMLDEMCGRGGGDSNLGIGQHISRFLMVTISNLDSIYQSIIITGIICYFHHLKNRIVFQHCQNWGWGGGVEKGCPLLILWQKDSETAPHWIPCGQMRQVLSPSSAPLRPLSLLQYYWPLTWRLQWLTGLVRSHLVTQLSWYCRFMHGVLKLGLKWTGCISKSLILPEIWKGRSVWTN
jgi:hypothetical protein